MQTGGKRREVKREMHTASIYSAQYDNTGRGEGKKNAHSGYILCTIWSYRQERGGEMRYAHTANVGCFNGAVSYSEWFIKKAIFLYAILSDIENILSDL